MDGMVNKSTKRDAFLALYFIKVFIRHHNDSNAKLGKELGISTSQKIFICISDVFNF